MIVAMILAGGTGSRVGAGRPKQFIEVFGKPIIAYTLDIYQKYPEVSAIEIVCHKDWRKYTENIVDIGEYHKVNWIIDGGKNFQKSVINGINELTEKISNDDIVMIHYAASPFTDSRIVADAIKVCKEKGMSASCIPCYQLMGTKDNAESRSWVNRDKYIQISCPQCYKFGYLKEIYRRSEEKGILENTEPHTTSLMYRLGETVYQSYGNQANIKITTADDIKLLKGLLLK